MFPFQPLSPTSSVGESSSASLFSYSSGSPNSQQQQWLEGQQQQRGQDQAAATPGCITPPDLLQRELEMEQQARACQDTPPELLQLILVRIQNLKKQQQYFAVRFLDMIS